MLNRALKSAGLVVALAIIAMPSASAQLVNGKWQAPARSGSAGAAAPRQGTEVRQDKEGGAKASVNNGAVPLRVIHAVLMSDGSIMADFGSGMEIVRRACPNSAASMPLRIVSSGSGTQPVPQLQPAPGMQPAPAQATASQQMAQSHAPSQAAQSSCHLRDQSGNIFATR